MIKDCLKNAKVYYDLSENIKKGLCWLENVDLDKLESGRYFIDGEKFYANVDEYETKEDANFEAHRKYIDIQYMINGKELVGVTNITKCTTCIKYDEERDLEFFSGGDNWQTLCNGEFLILFPHDAHKPCINMEQKHHCKKVVVKVPLG